MISNLNHRQSERMIPMNKENWTLVFEDYANKILDPKMVPGAIIALAKDGEQIYEHAFGYSDVELQQEITLDTVFGIGSITKSFSCIAILQLEEAGKLSVTDPVVTHLPQFRFGDEEASGQIAIHHFMSNSSGIPPLSSLFGAMRRSIEGDPDYSHFLPPFDTKSIQELAYIDTYDDLLAYLSASGLSLLGGAGSQFSYSNDAFGLLGAIIEKVSGMPYEVYVKKHILEPAGMTNTGFSISDLPEDTAISTLYTKRLTDGKPELFASPYWLDAPAQRAAGFLKSTARDMLRFAEIFRTGGCAGDVRILSEVSVTQMMTPHIGIDSFIHYGYGLFITPSPHYHGGSLVEHSGGIKGVSAQMHFLPEAGITGIVLINADGAFAVRGLLAAALNALHERPVDTPEFSYPSYVPGTPAMTEYSGDYSSSEGSCVSVSLSGETLNISVKMGEIERAIPLVPVGPDQFIAELGHGMSNSVIFYRDENRRVCRILFGFRQLTKADRKS